MVYLEKVGVVHRDQRAADALVHEDGAVKVADFGLPAFQAFDQSFTEVEPKWILAQCAMRELHFLAARLLWFPLALTSYKSVRYQGPEVASFITFRPLQLPTRYQECHCS